MGRSDGGPAPSERHNTMGIGPQRASRQVRWAGFLFLADFLWVWLAFAAGVWLRFDTLSWEMLGRYGPAVAIASFVLPAILYIGGLYSTRILSVDWIVGARWLLIGFLAVLATVLMIGSLHFSSRVGRGVLFASMAVLIGCVALWHGLIVRRRQRHMNSFLCLVSSAADERAALMLREFWGGKSRSFGIVAASGYRPSSDLPSLGDIAEMRGRNGERPLDAVLVRDKHFSDPEIAAFLRGLRYEGVNIVPLADACEEAYHAVPLEVVSDSWLFRASSQSQLFYTRKLKRLSDVVLAACFLVALSPFLALGALLVRLSSPGPILFRQERAGRFGRRFTVYKLRTMHLEAEPASARWANEEAARIFPAGKFLRQFRIDEIPQFVNILRGEMSFVGPRPEQVSIVDDLAEVLPFYRERLLIQPGLTGWAQVNYPYGASVEDAARKLEYELYYMKHMGLFLDFLILLETVKIVLSGGVKQSGSSDYLVFRRSFAELGVEDEMPHAKSARAK